MRLTMIIPGSGGRFYCQNCVRDTVLFSSLKSAGADVSVAPMYLPSDVESDWPGAGGKVFFGAVNAYLQEKSPIFRHTPRWIDAALDSRFVLDWAAGRAGSTKASGLGDMTLSMLRGTRGRQAKEVRRLAAWLNSVARPDVVFLSNALLLGLLPEIKSATGAAVVCGMQDEAPWVDAFDEPARSQCFAEMAGLAAQADALVAVSSYYAGVVSLKLGIPLESVSVIAPGIAPDAYTLSEGPRGAPVIGFLSRMNRDFGLDELAAAVTALSSEPGLQGLKLAVSGGGSGAEDGHLVREIRGTLGAAGRLTEQRSFDLRSRVAFFGKISVFCVPARTPEGFGMQALEAIACGVPVVMPGLGGYKELVETTGGGTLFTPGDRAAMMDGLRPFLLDKELARETGARGRENALVTYSGDRAAAAFMEIFEFVSRRKNSARD